MVDGATEYAQDIPVRVIAKMLGFPAEDADQFRDFVHTALEAVDLPVEERIARFARLDQYLTVQVQDHIENPRDDLTSFLLQAEMDGEPLNAEHVRGSIALLLTIGLLMVLSSSSVEAFRETGGSYATVKRQLLWVAIGIPLAWVASRVSPRWVRRLSYPAFSISLALLLLTAFLGVEVNGNTNWLVLGPVQVQPSEIAKLSLIIWASNIYAN